MKKTTIYILDSTKPFNGSVMSTMSAPAGHTPTHVDYTADDNGGKNMTFDQYKAFTNNPHLIQVEEKELEEKYWNPYYESLKTDWKETTEERFWDALECLPPRRQTKITKGSFFFVREAYTADIHSCFASINGKYYSSLRSINESTESIIKSTLNL